jgi:hypothetical protein
MEKTGNIEDQVMDNLLRSYVKQQRLPEVTCGGFDPDLASLYLERVLAENETSRYEIHLSKCSPCRSSVVALARFAEQEIPVALLTPIEDKQTINAAIEAEPKTVVESSSNWLARLQALLSVFATPRYALASAAAIVLAISIPLVISQKGDNARVSSERTASPADSSGSDAPSQLAQAPPPGSGVVAFSDANKDQPASAVKNYSGEPENAGTPSSSQGGAAIGSAAGGAAAPTPAAEGDTAKGKKEEAKSDSATVADSQPRANEPAAGVARTSEPSVSREATPPAPRVAERRDLQRIDPESTLRIPDNDKDAKATTLKPGRSDGTVATADPPKGGTIRPGDATAQPPSTPTESSRRKVMAESKSKSLRDENELRKERARASASRKIDNKTFFLIDDIWTDKDYRKDKELPVVTLSKESDEYKRVLEKHSGLQKFFTGFAANEKIIVVYKGTIYRLMPRDGN